MLHFLLNDLKQFNLKFKQLLKYKRENTTHFEFLILLPTINVLNIQFAGQFIFYTEGGICAEDIAICAENIGI